MVRKIFSFLHKEVNGVHNAAYILGIFAFLSQLLALIRDRLLAHSFGAGQMLDIYYGAFRVPDFLFLSIASLVSISVLIPFLSGKIPEHREEAKKFMDDVFTAFFIIMIFFSLIAYFLLPYLSHIILPGLKDQNLINEFVLFSRILLLQPIALGLSNLLGSITQVTNRFYVYAISPLLYNISIILGIVFLMPIFGLKGIIMGVVIGSILHVGIQIPYIFHLRMIPKFSSNLNFDVLKNVVLISLPRTLTLSLNSLELIFITSYASLMIAGSISIFNFSLNLQSVPFAIIGVSYSLAAFPTLSRLFNIGQKAEFLEHIIVATKHIIFWSLPVMALFIVLRAHIVRVILGSGNFNWDDTRLTAACLSLFVFSLMGQCLELLFIRGYYASGNTKKPLIINVISSIITIASPYFLIILFNSYLPFQYFIESLFKVNDIAGSAVLMLPLGYSIGTIVNMIVLAIAFKKDFNISFRPIFRTFRQSLYTGVMMGAVAYIFLVIFSQVFDTYTLPGIFFQGFFSGIIAILFGIIMFYALGNEEIKDVVSIILSKITKPKMVVLEQDKIE